MARGRIVLPRAGAANNSTAYDTPTPFVPAANIDNVMLFDASKDRPRFAGRVGFTRRFPGTLGRGGPVQGMGTVIRGRTPNGYRLGTSTDINGGNGEAHTEAGILGQMWLLDASWGLVRTFYENVSVTGPYGPDTGPANQPVNAVAINPLNTIVVEGSNYVDASGFLVGRVTARLIATGAVLWSHKIATASTPRFINAIKVTPDWVLVTSNQYVVCYELATGNAPAFGPQAFDCDGWSDEAIGMAVSADQQTLRVCFKGSSVAATLVNGPVVTSGKYAAHFRSGVMQFGINSPGELVPAGINALTKQPLSPQLPGGNRYYEGNHAYCRFSEQLPWKPQGCIPTAIANTPDGGFVVTHTNQGWGPSGNTALTNGDYQKPDGHSGYWNVSKFTSAGVYQWRADTASIIESGDGGFFNDIPTAVGDLASIVAVAVDVDGMIYCGGRRNLASADGVCAFCFSADGVLVWEQDLGATVRENAIAVMPDTQVPVFGGDRNNVWPGSGANNAHLWELRRDDGSINRYYDLNHAVSALCVVGRPALATGADSTRGLIYVTDKV